MTFVDLDGWVVSLCAMLFRVFIDISIIKNI